MKDLIRYVHGSEDSLDVDVYYVFDEMPDFNACKQFCCADKNENRNIIISYKENPFRQSRLRDGLHSKTSIVKNENSLL